jgi:hypothetical protein
MPKQKRQARQVGGKKEAPLAVVGESVVPHQTDDQIHLEPSQLEYIRYSELLRSFQAKLQRWQAVICTPENLERKKGDVGMPSTLELQWRVDIAYPSDRPYIIPKDTLLPPKGIVSIVAASGDRGLGKYLNIDTGGFTDPYTHKEILDIQFDIEQRTYHFLPKPQKDDTMAEPFYHSLLVTKDYGEALEFSINNLEGKLHLEVGRNRRVPAKDRETILSVDHAAALFNFMDTIIPSSSTSHISQPDSRATPELQSPKALPPARRTRPPSR